MHLLIQAKNNVSALELKRHLGVRYKSVWLIQHKLLQIMFEREDFRQLDGHVEIDDAYLGGASSGGKRGRGSEYEMPFIAAVQTTESGHPDHPELVCLKKLEFTKSAIAQWAKQSLCASARVVTGGGVGSVKIELSSWPDCFAHRLSLHPVLNAASAWLNNVANQANL